MFHLDEISAYLTPSDIDRFFLSIVYLTMKIKWFSDNNNLRK